MEVVNKLYKRRDLNGPGNDTTLPIHLDDVAEGDPVNKIHTPEGVADSTSHSARTNNNSIDGGKKRKACEGIDGLINLLERLHDDINARLEGLSLRIRYEFNLSKARKEVYELLGRLSDLTRDQKFDGGEIILGEVERLDFFFGIPR